MKLERKIHLYSVLLFIGLLIMISITIYFLFKNILTESEIQAAEKEIDNILIGVSESLGNVNTGNLLRAYLPVNGSIQIVFEDGSRPFMVSSTEVPLHDQKATFFPNERKETVIVEGTHFYFHSLPILWEDGTIANLQVAKSIQAPYEHLKILRTVFITVTLIALIPIIASSRLLSRLIMNPILSLTRTMKEISDSGEFKRIPMENVPKDELGQMAKTFNSMMDLLETNFLKQEQFLSNASHELKTPLTVIESYASLLKRRGLHNPELFNESIEAVHSEAIRMKEMTERLLLLAKPEKEWRINRKALKTDEFLKSIIQSFSVAFNREIEVITDGPVKIISDEQHLRQLISILLENAVKYSEEKITVSVGMEKKQPFIRIADRGIGIPQKDIPHIFDRFYRVEQARTRKFGGTGLGLSMAKTIADLLSCRIHVESAVGVGTSFTIYFPTEDDIEKSS